MNLRGRKAIITGASQGFGLAVAKELTKAGAEVALCARNSKTLEQASNQLMQLSNKSVLCVKADVTCAEDMERFVLEALDTMGNIDIVIANAGIYGPKGALETIDWQEWSEAIDINLKGAVLICKAALPHLKAQQYGKIILLSGGGATKPMPFLSAYAASKAAVVRFAETLAQEVKNDHIDVNAVAPGALNTRLLDEVLAAGPEKVGEDFYQQSLQQKHKGGSPLEIGARLCAYLASAESDGITGKLISAVWDPWQQFDKFKEQLQKTDIYTLRRIVPEDRQQNWEESC